MDMIEIIKKLYRFTFHTEKGLYLFFGALTTLVAFLSFGFADAFLGEDLLNVSTIFKNICAIVFAYFTNRIFVFHSLNRTKRSQGIEIFQFFAIRGALIYVDVKLVNLLTFSVGIHRYISTLFVTLLIIVLNYYASKIVIFKRKG